ncbi:hypothetical protein [uncultured Mucilaginibacter sp.]|uniref:hypothetical protein n=1 Tax=uncultured Mucilaginibacter sp. TaxID=797541 RepID=UPI0025EFCAEB|nr:hypothetical protein [uncultured Mucilaginibacter sp.]
MPPKKERKDPAYLREQGNREAQTKKVRKITFSLIQLIVNTEGQTLQEWEELGLLSDMNERLQFVGQFSCQEAIQKQYLKPYTKVSFPPDSEFTQPKHISSVDWTVMHITSKSKEVVVGYIEDDTFYIVFLDKDHKFWPMTK